MNGVSDGASRGGDHAGHGAQGTRSQQELDHCEHNGPGASSDETMDEAEAARIITQGAGHVMMVMDTFGTIRYVSPNARVILGRHANDLVGRCMVDLSPAEDLARIVDSHEGVLDGAVVLTRQRMQLAGGLAWVETTQRLSDDGDERWIVCTIRREPGACESAAWSRDR